MANNKKYDKMSYCLETMIKNTGPLKLCLEFDWNIFYIVFNTKKKMFFLHFLQVSKCVMIQLLQIYFFCVLSSFMRERVITAPFGRSHSSSIVSVKNQSSTDKCMKKWDLGSLRLCKVGWWRAWCLWRLCFHREARMYVTDSDKEEEGKRYLVWNIRKWFQSIFQIDGNLIFFFFFLLYIFADKLNAWMYVKMPWGQTWMLW